MDIKKALKDFWYGKPHTAEEGGRRLGDLHEDKTHLYKHREWRGFKDTMYYFYMIWLYNYIFMVKDVMVMGGLVNFAKGVWRYRWVGQTYLPVLHWFDRGLEGMRGEAMKASAWHYRAMVSTTIRQFQRMFAADTRLHGGKQNDIYKHTFAHNETVWGGMFYPWSDKFQNVPLEMIPYFVTCHVNSHVVLNYIDAVQSIGLPGDPCPMCQAESGIFVLDDVPDYAPLVVTCNEACDASVSTSTLQDWFFDKPLFSLPMPMIFDDPLVKKYCMREIEECWKFIEDQTGVPFNMEQMVKKLEQQNELQRFEWEKWDVICHSDYYPVNGVAQALYRIYQTQYGDWEIWHQLLPADPPPRDRLVLRSALLLQLVHLGLQLLGPECGHQHGLPDVRHDHPHRLLREHARGLRAVSHVGTDAPYGRRRHEAHVRAVGVHGALQLRYGRHV